MEESIKVRVFRRLQSEGRWDDAEPHRDRLVKEARANGMRRAEAHDWAYGQLDAMFPPLGTDETGKDDRIEGAPGEGDARNADGASHSQDGEGGPKGDARNADGRRNVAEMDAGAQGETGTTVVGLGDLPPLWPELPPNAPLSTEIAWVLANRVRCVRESPSGAAVVDLRKALSPAPSYAALGWLETSIRAFSKFVDVSAKASSQSQDDQEKVRRERMSIEEVRSILTEMLAAKDEK